MSVVPARPGTAREHYRQRREHGDCHAAANRHLFNKLLGQLYHCLQNQHHFDEAKAFPGVHREESTLSRTVRSIETGTTSFDG